MERLTTYRADGKAAITNHDNATHIEQVFKIPDVINRLAAYEDTGLEPEQVAKMAAEWTKYETAMSYVDELGGIDRLREQTHADKLIKKVVRCRECKHARESEEAFDLDGETPLCECAYMTQPNRWNEYCSWGERKEADHEISEVEHEKRRRN